MEGGFEEEVKEEGSVEGGEHRIFFINNSTCKLYIILICFIVGC